jgi:hypothetical protein
MRLQRRTLSIAGLHSIPQLAMQVFIPLEDDEISGHKLALLCHCARHENSLMLTDH